MCRLALVPGASEKKAMRRGLVPWGGLAVPVRSDGAGAALARGTLLSEEMWSVCRELAPRLPRRVRVELHTQPGEPRVGADPRAVRREFAALLQRSAALLGSRAGVLVVGVLVAARGAPGDSVSPAAWIAVRLFRRPEAPCREGIWGGTEGPRRSQRGTSISDGAPRALPSRSSPPPMRGRDFSRR
jgi:hypothetical protein